MKRFILLFLLIQCNCFSQNEINSFPLKHLSPIEETSDLGTLDSLFTNRKIIGVGESTHGTSEFTAMRYRLFKYLVENHEFNTFFLEADVGACQRINRYIQGEKDSVHKALNEVRLWPWLTKEMIDFIEWMREYNLTAQNKIDFIGCDMQLIEDDILELNRLYSMNCDSCSNNEFPIRVVNRTDTTLLLNEYRKWNQFKLTCKAQSKNTLLCQSIDQWFNHEFTTSYRGNFRDSCMAMNIITYINKNPNAKGFYFAHNWHVSKTNRINDGNIPNTKTTGHFLYEKYGISYFSIAQDFLSGSFNAIDYVDSEYRMEEFNFESGKRKSIAFQAMKSKSDLQFVVTNNLPGINKLSMNFIGAIYGNSKSGHPIPRYRKGLDTYDAFILMRETTPSALLKNSTNTQKK